MAWITRFGRPGSGPFNVSPLVEAEQARPHPYEVCTETTDRSQWHPNVRLFHQYWLEIKTPDRLPGRQQFDPLTIPTILLPNIWLFHVHRDPLRFRIRLMGTRLVEILGTELTGRWFDETRPPSPDFDAIAKRLERTASEGIVTHSNASVAMVLDREHYRAENVTFPLARDGTTVDMIAGFSWITALSGRKLS